MHSEKKQLIKWNLLFNLILFFNIKKNVKKNVVFVSIEFDWRQTYKK